MNIISFPKKLLLPLVIVARIGCKDMTASRLVSTLEAEGLHIVEGEDKQGAIDILHAASILADKNPFGRSYLYQGTSYLIEYTEDLGCTSDQGICRLSCQVVSTKPTEQGGAQDITTVMCVKEESVYICGVGLIEDTAGDNGLLITDPIEELKVVIHGITGGSMPLGKKEL